jgi:acyl carrier protein
VSAELAEVRIKEIVVEQLGLAVDDVQLESVLVTDLGADVLDVMELIMAVEEEFEVEVDDEAAEGIKTVQNLVDLVSFNVQ